MNNKSTIVRAILLDASECERPEAEHPAAIEISAEDPQRILERHITAAPQATPFMWAIQDPGGAAYMDDGCVSSVREDVQAEVDGLNSGLDADDDPYKVVPVYLAAAQQAAVHPDDAAVDALAALMKAKLAKQRAKGYGGWNDKTQCPQQRLSDMLRAHVDKGDPVDVANFCAMLSARGEGIAAAPQAAVPDAWAAVHFGGKRNGKIYNTCDTEKECNDYIAMVHQQSDSTTLTAKPVFFAAAPTHPAEGVPEQAAPGMTAERASYFMRRFLKEEKLLGPNEQAAMHYVISLLAATQPAAQDLQLDTLKLARDRLADMLEDDDGQAWKEARKAMPIIDAALAAQDKQGGENP